MRNLSPIVKVCAVLLLALGTCLGGPFVAPSTGPLPFRIDKLPIDIDSIKGLSDSLSTLPANVPLQNAALRRAAAQSLALAIALDPANIKARSHIVALTSGKQLEKVPDAIQRRSRAQIWHLHGWLASAEAGENGNILANLISDSAAFLDPKHPNAEMLRKAERGDWSEWVAPLADFQEPAPAEKKPAEAVAVADPFSDIAPTETAPVKPLNEKFIKTTLNTVLFGKTPGQSPITLRPIFITATPAADQQEAFTLMGGKQQAMHQSVSDVVINALNATKTAIPQNTKLTFFAKERQVFGNVKNHDDLTGPAFVLTSASLNGIPLDATLIGKIDGKGNVSLPDYFWRRLSTLTKGKGGRLVVPAAAAEHLQALLAFENPEFFLKYEVLIASNAQDMLRFCAAEPPPELAAVLAKFAAIQDRAPDVTLGAYLANRFVRQRLEEIAAEAPYHASARMLALQGSGARPRTPSREILASEVWLAVDPIHPLAQQQIGINNQNILRKLEAAYDSARTQLNGLERYADIRDRDLIEKGRSLTSAVRGLTRAMRSRDAFEKYQEVATAHAELIAANTAFRQEFSRIAGQPLDKKK